jgi:hypothetical protein
MNRPDIFAGETLTDRTAMQVRCPQELATKQAGVPSTTGTPTRRRASGDGRDAGLGCAECGAGAAASTIADLHRYRRAGAATVRLLPSRSVVRCAHCRLTDADFIAWDELSLLHDRTVHPRSRP